MVRNEPQDSHDLQFPAEELEHAAMLNGVEGYIVRPLCKSDYEKG